MLVGGAGTATTLQMRTQCMLLAIAAVVEAVAGLAFILTPSATLRLLLGGELDDVGLMIGRLMGVGMLALGVACWGAWTDSGGAARAGTVAAITLYNAGSGLLLVLFAVTGQASGLGVWSGGLFHLALAAGFLASQRRLGASPAAKSGA